MRKYIPYLCVLVTVIIITISILYNKDKEEDSFIYFYNSYNLSSSVTEEDFLNINIYVNNKKTYFVDKNQISTCYIEGGEDIINLDIINISSNNENIVYKNNEYYCFNFKFKLFFDTANFTTWFLKDVNLIINYNNDKEYVLKIGDISINSYLASYR